MRLAPADTLIRYSVSSGSGKVRLVYWYRVQHLWLLRLAVAATEHW